MFHQTREELISLSETFKKELDDLKQKGYYIGGKPDQTFLFKLDGGPGFYTPAPTSPFHFFIKESDIMSFDNVQGIILPVDKQDYAI